MDDGLVEEDLCQPIKNTEVFPLYIGSGHEIAGQQRGKHLPASKKDSF